MDTQQDGGRWEYYITEASWDLTRRTRGGPSAESDSGGDDKWDVAKDYFKSFDCNKSVRDIFDRMRTHFPDFANFVGDFGLGGAPTSTGITTFGKTLISKGAEIPISNINIINTPPLEGRMVSFNVSVTVSAVSTMTASMMGFSFTTNKGHVLYPANISFNAADLGDGKVGFGINVRGNFANTAAQGAYYAGGYDLENKIWNNVINNVSKYCGN